MFNVNARQFSFGDWEATQDFNFTCPVCEGEGTVKVECEHCDGDGSIECEVCQGEYSVGKENECQDCFGVGYVDCIECEEGYLEGEDCEDCENGYVIPIWNTAWEIELHDIFEGTKADILQTTNCTVFSDDEGTYYLGLTGCGMNLTPDLCKAWLKLGFGWLPSDLISSVKSSGFDYCKYVAGEEWVKKIHEIAIETMESAAIRARHSAEQLRNELEKGVRA